MISFRKMSVVPSGLGIYFTTNPALKCRAIVIASLRDGQTPNASIVHPKMRTGKEALTISNCELRVAESATRQGHPQITQIAQISFLPSASSAKSADKLSGASRPLNSVSVCTPCRAAATSGLGSATVPVAVSGVPPKTRQPN
jgi:hypothetical protein